jgi:hypothetical protein
VFIGIVVVVGIVLAQRQSPDDGTGSDVNVDSDDGGLYEVTYVVDGDSNRADLTYQNANGDTSQESEVAVPWELSFSAFEGDFLYISAQRGEAPGDISCTIEVDGVAVETNTSSGPFTICTASGSL